MDAHGNKKLLQIPPVGSAGDLGDLILIQEKTKD
jgi:hypothetical protein